MNNRLIVRVDAHRHIALGHLKRCIALGDALQRENFELLFICMEDDSARAILGKSGFSFQLVPEEVNTGVDKDRTMKFIRSYGAKGILLDSYNINAAYSRFFMEQGLVTMYIDDLTKIDVPCHVVINGIPGSERIAYRAPMKLLGMDFLILGKEYWNPPAVRMGKVDNILVTMGGIDHYDLSIRTLRILEKHKRDFSISVVVGPYYENRDRIEAQVKRMTKKVEYFFNPDGLFPLIDKCDMAISAGGFTLYEFATMRKSVVGISLWENQNNSVKELGDKGIVKPLFYSDDVSFDAMLEEEIFTLLEDEKRRYELSINGQRYFDGQGAIRVANHITKFIGRGYEQERK